MWEIPDAVWPHTATVCQCTPVTLHISHDSTVNWYQSLVMMLVWKRMQLVLFEGRHRMTCGAIYLSTILALSFNKCVWTTISMFLPVLASQVTMAFKEKSLMYLFLLHKSSPKVRCNRKRECQKCLKSILAIIRQRKPETYKDVIRRSQRLLKEMQEEMQGIRQETRQVRVHVIFFLTERAGLAWLYCKSSLYSRYK